MLTDSALLFTHGSAVVIDDDLDVRDLVCAVLKQVGFDVHSAATGRAGVNLVLRNAPTVVTLDVGLPDIDGHEVLRRIRDTSNCYVIMLTARNDEPDVLTALLAGADDYLSKPFRPRELRARIDALLRRPTTTPPHIIPAPGTPAPTPGTPVPSQHAPTAAPASPPASNAASGSASDGATSPAPSSARGPGPGSVSAAWTPGVLRHGELVVDRESWTVRVAGQDVLLTRSEFDLLHEMLRSDGAVRTKAELVTVLHGGTHHGSSYISHISDTDRRAVEVHIGNLRRKLSDHPGMVDLITTIRGVGYRITPSPPQESRP